MCSVFFISYRMKMATGLKGVKRFQKACFKTYEGRISMESFGALKNTSPIAEVRDFSVESENDQVLKDLEQVALTGERVNLKFKECLFVSSGAVTHEILCYRSWTRRRTPNTSYSTNSVRKHHHRLDLTVTPESWLLTNSGRQNIISFLPAAITKRCETI